MTKKLTTLGAALALSAGLVLAQRPGRMNNGGTPPDPATMIQRHVDRLATLLNLTDAQKTQATTLFTQAQTDSQGLHESMRTAHQSLRDAVKANDTTAITQAASQIGNLTGQLLAIQGKTDAAFYSQLTADQKAKFDAMRPAGPMGMGGPGMMGRMGPMGRGAGPR